MFPGPSTSWSSIQGAARGSSLDRDRFVSRYGPLMRAYLDSRWHGGPLEGSLEDAVQDVFVECLRHDGVLARAQAASLGSIRAFLLVSYATWPGARSARFQTPRGDGEVALDPIDGSPAASGAFDRAWARAVVAEALELQRREAAARGERALRRIELLRLRFEEGLPIRDVAARWGDPVPLVQREYRAARRDYREALVAVQRLHLGEGGGRIEEAEHELRELFS
jgi:DNA-directed RNA polymerase specialized sigma24 family protein